MKKIGAGTYDIFLGRGLLSDAGSYFDLSRKVLIVTDTGVPEAYASRLAEASKEPYILRIPAGEESKSLENFSRLLSGMLSRDFTRKDAVVASGGGVVGDLSGFAAACYMRGIDFYNVPTTLLSQVDSSIGGKTAIDFGGVKNPVGAFYPPKGVLIDPDTLATLPLRELSAGLAEAVKMAVTGDEELFCVLEESGGIRDDLETVIERSLLYKRDVVTEDPKEQGLRKVLNFGHTLGHAVESAFGGTLLHGECVALGMLPFSGPKVRERLLPVLEKYGLPCTADITGEALLPYLLHDKKAGDGEITVVRADEIGAFTFEKMSAADIVKQWDRTREELS